MKKWLIGCLMALVMVCLMGITANAETSRNYCYTCKKSTVFEVLRYIPTPISSVPDPEAHWAEGKCTECGQLRSWVPDNDSQYHTGGTETPTCTTGKTCEKCGAEYGKLGHIWGQWQSSGDNRTHTRPCLREGCDAVDTAACGGDSNATCVTMGTCTDCGQQYYGGHAFPERWKWFSETEVGRDAEQHWLRCLNCAEGKAHESNHLFGPGNMYLKSEATCVSKPVYYVNCTTCYYQGTDTYVYEWGNTNPNNHDGGTEVKNAKAATCTEKGYTGDTHCKGCDVKLSDGTDIPALGHKLTHVAAKRATSFVAGNIEYWYCTVCGRYYRDAAAAQEITKEATVTHKESAPIQGNKTVESSKTGDAGVMLYAGMAVLSLTGCAWLRRKEK